MKKPSVPFLVPVCAFIFSFVLAEGTVNAQTIIEQNRALIEDLKKMHTLTPEQVKKIEEILASSNVMSQGNPAVTKHPMTQEACAEKRKGIAENPEFEKICGAKHMSPLYAAGGQAADATSCIDQFEFPNIPCSYPLVWTKANEAAEICHAMGKRLCDAHEWEGACQGDLTEADYPFELAVGKNDNDAVKAMRAAHNRKHAAAKKWSFGPAPKKGVCGMNSTKNEGCNGGDWKRCGSNTYPAGSFPDCKSSLGVYDLNGNAAEHMNLPLKKDQMASLGSRTYGVTEMKGSWFIWDKFAAHEDWCRWRAPYWHGSKLLDPKSHHNYHLSFRCCSDTTKK
jgi:formylglycine-generating enzyme required for sulfatase activity